MTAIVLPLTGLLGGEVELRILTTSIGEHFDVPVSGKAFADDDPGLDEYVNELVEIPTHLMVADVLIGPTCHRRPSGDLTGGRRQAEVEPSPPVPPAVLQIPIVKVGENASDT